MSNKTKQNKIIKTIAISAIASITAVSTTVTAVSLTNKNGGKKINSLTVSNVDSSKIPFNKEDLLKKAKQLQKLKNSSSDLYKQKGSTSINASDNKISQPAAQVLKDSDLYKEISAQNNLRHVDLTDAKLFRDNSNNIYIATANEGIWIYKANNEGVYPYQPKKWSTENANKGFVFEDSNGTIFVGTNDHGLKKYYPNTGTLGSVRKLVRGIASDIDTNNSWMIQDSRTGKIIVGTEKDGMIIITKQGQNMYFGEKVFISGENNKFLEHSCVLKMRNGRILLGTELGIYQFDPSGIKRNYNTSSYSMSGYGYSLDGSRITHLNTLGLPFGTMVEGENGIVYLKTVNDGVHKLIIRGSNSSQTKLIQANESSMGPVLFKTSNGTIYVGTNKGLKTLINDKYYGPLVSATDKHKTNDPNGITTTSMIETKGHAVFAIAINKGLIQLNHIPIKTSDSDIHLLNKKERHGSIDFSGIPGLKNWMPHISIKIVWKRKNSTNGTRYVRFGNHTSIAKSLGDLTTGDTVTFTYIPDPGYAINKKPVSGLRNKPENNYTYTYTVPKLKGIIVPQALQNILGDPNTNPVLGTNGNGILEINPYTAPDDSYIFTSVIDGVTGMPKAVQLTKRPNGRWAYENLKNGDHVLFSINANPGYVFESTQKFNQNVTWDPMNHSVTIDRVIGSIHKDIKIPVLSQGLITATGDKHHGIVNIDKNPIINPAIIDPNLELLIEVVKKDGTKRKFLSTYGQIPANITDLNNGDKFHIKFTPKTNFKFAGLKYGESVEKTYVISGLQGSKQIDLTNKLHVVGVNGQGKLTFNVSSEIDQINKTPLDKVVVTITQKGVTTTKTWYSIDLTNFLTKWIDKKNMQSKFANGDKITFTFFAKGNYVYRLGTETSSKKNAKGEIVEKTFTYTVKGLVSSITIPPIPNSSKPQGYENNGTTSLIDVYRNIPAHTQLKIQVIDSSGNVLRVIKKFTDTTVNSVQEIKKLKNGQRIEFIYKPENGYVIKGKKANETKTLSLDVKDLKLIKVDIDALERNLLHGTQAKGVLEIVDYNNIKHVDHATLVIRLNGQVIVPVFNTQENRWEIVGVKNTDIVEYIYTADKTFVFDKNGLTKNLVPSQSSKKVYFKGYSINTSTSIEQVTFTRYIKGLDDKIMIAKPNLTLTGKIDKKGVIKLKNVVHEIPHTYVTIEVTDKNGNVTTYTNKNAILPNEITNLKNGDKISVTYTAKPGFKVKEKGKVSLKGKDKITFSNLLTVSGLKTEITTQIPDPKATYSGIDGNGHFKITNLSNIIATFKGIKGTPIVEVQRKNSSGWTVISLTDKTLSNGDKLRITFLPDGTHTFNGKTALHQFVLSPITSLAKGELDVIVPAINVTGTKYHGLLDINALSFGRKIQLQEVTVDGVVVAKIVNGTMTGVNNTLNISLVNGVLNGLNSSQKIVFVVKPEKGYQIKGTPTINTAKTLPPHIIKNLKGLEIVDPTKNSLLSGMEGKGLLPFDIKPHAHTHLKIEVWRKGALLKTINPSSLKIELLKNGDKIKFIYTADKTYVIEDQVSGLSSKTTVTSVKNSKGEAIELTFTYEVSGLSNTIHVGKNVLKNITYISEVEKHGLIDISKIPGGTDEIKNLTLTVKIKLKSGVIKTFIVSKATNMIDNLTTGDEIEFIYTPDPGFKIENGQVGKALKEKFIVKKLHGIVVDKTLQKILGTNTTNPSKGRQGKGVIEIDPIVVPKFTTVEFWVKTKGQTTFHKVTLGDKNGKKIIQNLKNGDEIEVRVIPIQGYVLEHSQSLVAGVSSLVTPTGSSVEIMKITRVVSGIDNDITPPTLPNKLSVTGVENHGSVDLTLPVLTSVDPDVDLVIEVTIAGTKKTYSSVKGNIPANITDSLRNGDKIKIIFTPHSGFKFKGKNLNETVEKTYIISGLKGIQVTDPTKDSNGKANLFAVGLSNKAHIDLTHIINSKPAHVTLTIKVNGQVVSLSSNNWIENLNNKDKIEFIYTPDSTYEIEQPNGPNGEKIFSMIVDGLAVPVDITKLASLVSVSGTNKNPIIDIDPKANVKGAKVEFSIGGSWFSKTDIIKEIKKTFGQKWLTVSVGVRYVSTDPKIKLDFKNRVKTLNVSKNSLKMIITNSMMKQMVALLKNKVSFKAGTTSKKVMIERIDIAEIQKLETTYGLKLVFRNSITGNWELTPPTTFNGRQPYYEVMILPSGTSTTSTDTALMKFENVVDNKFKLDTSSIPSIITISPTDLAKIKNTNITGKIDISNNVIDWLIDGKKTIPTIIKNLIQRGSHILVEYRYNGKKYASLIDLLTNAKLDKDTSSNIQMVITAEKGKQKFVIEGANKNTQELVLDISIDKMIQQIDLRNRLGKNFIVSTKSTKAGFVEITFKANKDGIEHASHLKFLLGSGSKTSGQMTLKAGETYEIIITPELGWELVGSQGGIFTSTNPKKYSNLIAQLKFDNKIVKSVKAKFEKFNTKGTISKNIINLLNVQGSQLTTTEIKFFEIRVRKAGTQQWMKISQLTGLKNKDKIEVEIIPKKGYTFNNKQPVLTLTVVGLVDEIDATNLTFSKHQLKYNGTDGNGLVDPTSITGGITGLSATDKDKVTLHLIITDKNGKVKFNGQITDKNGKTILTKLSVGDKVKGYFEVKEKYKNKFGLSNNKTKINSIDLGQVTGLSIHPDIFPPKATKNAFNKLGMGAVIKIVGNKITVIFTSQKIGSLVVPSGKHWHYVYWVGTSTRPTNVKVGTLDRIDDLITNAQIKSNETIYIGVEADKSYTLDKPYAPFAINTKDLKKMIDVSTLKPLSIHITGINGKGKVDPVSQNLKTIIVSPTNEMTGKSLFGKFIVPAGTHLVYGLVPDNKLQTIDSLNKNVKKWVTDPSLLKITVGVNVVAKLVPNDKKTVLSGKYFTKYPIKATNLTIDLTKVHPTLVAVGMNKHAKLKVKTDSTTDPQQLKGITWRVKTSKGIVDLDKLTGVKNGQTFTLIPVAKKGYKLPTPLPTNMKNITLKVKGLKIALMISPAVKVTIADKDIWGQNQNGKLVSLIGKEPIQNGKADLTKIELFQLGAKGKFDKSVLLSFLNGSVKLTDEDGNVVSGVKLEIVYQVNGQGWSTNKPTNLENGDKVEAKIVVSKSNSKKILDKYAIADKTVGSNGFLYHYTYIVHGLMEKAPELGKVTALIPSTNSNGKGTIVIGTENKVPNGFVWKYRVTTSKGVVGKWTSVPHNLKNGDKVEYKLVSVKGTPMTKDYKGEVKVKGLIKALTIDPKIKKMIDQLMVDMSFTGDNGTGTFTNETKQTIDRINAELEKKYGKNSKLTFELLQPTNVSTIDSDTHKLANENKIGIKIKLSSFGEVALENDSIEVEGLRNADKTINKTLMWGIIAGILGVLTLGVGIAIATVLSKRKLVK